MVSCRTVLLNFLQKCKQKCFTFSHCAVISLSQMSETTTFQTPQAGKTGKRTIVIPNVSESTVKTLDLIADEKGLTRSALIRLVMDRAVEQNWTFNTHSAEAPRGNGPQA